jgi:hypothetical protein
MGKYFYFVHLINYFIENITLITYNFNYKRLKMKVITIIDAFITDPKEEQLLVNFIDSVKTMGDDLFLTSNTPISKEIQGKVENFFYDHRNQLFKEKYEKYEWVNYWTKYETFKVNNTFIHTQKHGLSVLINLYRAVAIAKDLGYTHFYKMEYDAIMGNETKDKIQRLNKECVENNQKGVFFIENFDNHSSMSVHYFFCEIDFFLNNFWNIKSEEDYIKFIEKEYGYKNFQIMENFMYENLKKINPVDVDVREDFFGYFSDTFWNSKQTRVYYEKESQECASDIYLCYEKKDDVYELKNELVLYSVNVKSEPDYRRFVIKYDDDTEETIIQEFIGYGHCNFNFIKKNIIKLLVYNETEFLYEKEIKEIRNKIEIN